MQYQFDLKPKYSLLTKQKSIPFVLSDAQLCPVDMHKLYRSKLNPTVNRLWQRPKTIRLNYGDNIWYNARAVDHDTIEKYMKTLIKEAELLNPKHKKHSIHKTCLMTRDEAGIEGRHMIYLSSHKSEATIRVHHESP